MYSVQKQADLPYGSKGKKVKVYHSCLVS